MSFLDDQEFRPLEVSEASGFRPLGLALGKGPQAVEVAVVQASHRPSLSELRALWKARLKGRATPLLLVALHNGRAALCGPAGEQPPAHPDLVAERVERICRAALAEPDRHSALRFLRTAIGEIEAPISGLRNEGLFASHELERGVPFRKDWGDGVGKARAVIDKRGQALLEAIGFTVERLAGPASILRAAGTKTAVAVLLERDEPPDVSSTRFSGLSPVSYALAKADEENLSWVVVCGGPAVRLYPARAGVGTGQRGRTETYLEIHLDLIEREAAGYLWLLLSADALKSGGTVEEILADSGRYAADLGKRLRDRIYAEVIPPLAERMMTARGIRNPTADDLAQTYQMALTLLFRVLFIAYAEDKELLPYRGNDAYRSRSLKHKALELQDIVRKEGMPAVETGTPFDAGSSHWEEIERLCNAVNLGNKEWGIPKYNGGLFSTDPTVSNIGAALTEVHLNNKDLGPILAKLLLDRADEGWGPVDFRSLGVREFGTIYEGLLENELSVAETDLTTDRTNTYRPAGPKDEIVVRARRPYLHNKSGARKASGSYFTKHFAVEHLLNYALEPALTDHISRLDRIADDRAAADAFFDFRVADIAMGSGHFLVAAIDRIERKLSSYLVKRQLTDVVAELARLRNSAREALGPLADSVEIEDAQLLRRQIARRCIYGVDLNPIAVELARLSVWIHTFIPGLPLSFLDHNLVVGNSLVGIATIEEANEWLKEISAPLWALSAEKLLGHAREALSRLGRVSDADAAEIEAARKAASEARESVKGAEALFDLLTAARLDVAIRGQLAEWAQKQGELEEKLSRLPSSRMHHLALNELKAMPPSHFPIVFPEVFLRERSGFDVIIGNPPWEEATVEEDRFWTRYEPGFHSLPQGQQESAKKKLRRERLDLVRIYEEEKAQVEVLRRVLTSGPFPGMGTGDPDVYKAFAWRFWDLAERGGGRIGVVLPRSAWAARGSHLLRTEVFSLGTIADITFLLNRGGWVFDDAEHRYTIALSSFGRGGVGDATIPVRGPFADPARYSAGILRSPVVFAARDVIGWTDSAALPLLPSEEAGEVFLQLRRAPRLDLDDAKSWLARPYAELHATNDKKLIKFGPTQPDGFWPVFKGESFDIWISDTGSYYGWADPDKVRPLLQQKRLRSAKLARSPFQGFSAAYLRDEKTLPCNYPRIAFRDVTNRTNQRTVIVALLPPKIFITNKGPYFLWPRGDEKDQAYLLGVMSSIPFDWYARRFVEVSLNYHVLNPFPVPRPKRSDLLWQRVVTVAGRLASTDRRFSRWAEAVGVESGPLHEDERTTMIYELDAVVAHLYGLSESQLSHVFQTFHEGWDYTTRLRATLDHFRTGKGRGSGASGSK